MTKEGVIHGGKRADPLGADSVVLETRAVERRLAQSLDRLGPRSVTLDINANDSKGVRLKLPPDYFGALLTGPPSDAALPAPLQDESLSGSMPMAATGLVYYFYCPERGRIYGRPAPLLKLHQDECFAELRARGTTLVRTEVARLMFPARLGEGGRFRFSRAFLDGAGVTREIMICGGGTRLEVWDHGTFWAWYNSLSQKKSG